jgi:hypothetical protein
MDFDKVDQVATVTTDVTVVTSPATATPTTDIPFWAGYPQNLFGNWTPDQVERSQMLIKCSKNHSSTVYWMDVLDKGSFIPSKMGNSETTGTVTRLDEHAFWDSILQGEVGLTLSFVCWFDIRWIYSDPEVSECDHCLWMT